MARRTSEAGRAAIARHEGLRLKAYPDPATGGEPWTIGVGHTSSAGPPKVFKGMRITAREADEILSRDLATFEAAVNSAVKVDVSQNEFDALTSLAFNIGAGALKKSTLVKKLNAGDRKGAANAFLSWNKAAGKVMKGLTKRRQDERALFLKPMPTPPPLSPEAQVLLLPESEVLRAAYPAPANSAPSAFQRVVFAVQSHITKLGYPCGKIDGVAGALTAEALRAAQADNGLKPTGAVDVATVNGIMAWRHRIIAPERQNITPDKVAATVPEAKSNAWTRFWAKIGAWGGSAFTGGVGAAQLLEATGQAKTITDTVKDYLPSPSMLLLCAVFVAILVLVIRSTNKTEAEVTEAVRTAARR